jgi:hypothetical protein
MNHGKVDSRLLMHERYGTPSTSKRHNISSFGLRVPHQLQLENACSNCVNVTLTKHDCDRIPPIWATRGYQPRAQQSDIYMLQQKTKKQT